MHAAQKIKLQPSTRNMLNISALLVLHRNEYEGEGRKSIIISFRKYTENQSFLISTVKHKGELWDRSNNVSWLLSQH